jgi:hypothetical protein
METITSVTFCPSCARAVTFMHPSTTLLVCGCGSVVHRDGAQIRTKPIPIIQQPTDAIQPGTKGQYKGRPFDVLGRFRAWMEEFVFNYWTLAFADGSIGYLAEGYGIYALYEPAPTGQKITSAALSRLRLCSMRDNYLLERAYVCYKWEVEGELLIPQTAATFRTFEFAALDGQHTEVMDFGNDQVFQYQVQYLSLAELQLQNSRSTTPLPKPMNCTHCQKQTVLKGFPYTQSFGCPHCGSRYSLRDGYRYEKENNKPTSGEGPYITLGSKGILHGVEYETVGYVLKEEQNSYHSRWKEYTLYHPEAGFAFLSEYGGHWIFVREQPNAPVLASAQEKTFTYDKEPFQLYNAYSYAIIHATGEFPYNIFNDEDRKVREFISPPEVWIREHSNREGILWYHGTHIEGKALEEAFGEAIILPVKEGVGAVEPKGFVSPIKIAVMAFLAVLLLFFAHLATTLGAQKRILLEQTYNLADTLSTTMYTSSRFHLDEWRSNLQVDVQAPVDNSWFELGAALVNEKTGTEYSLEQGVEYYYGYTDGENWKEGSRSETAYLSRIPAGTYYLQLQGTPERYNGEPGRISQFHVRVTYDTPNDRNFVFCLIAVLVWAFLHYQVVQYQEKSRWSNSPFSPFNEAE